MLGRLIGPGFLLALVATAYPDGPRGLDPATFRLAKVQRGDLTRVLRLDGVLRPEQTASLRSRVGSTVEKIHVREGQAVKAGDVLVQLDARLQELGLDLARVQVQKARGDVEQAEANRKQAEMNFERQRRLFEAKAAGEPDVLTARTALSQAQGRADEARSNVLIAELSLRKAQLDADTTRIVAPFAGVVLEIGVTAGELVRPGGERVILLASSPETLIFRALVESRDARAGLAITVEGVATKVERIVPVWREIDDIPHQTLEARVANAERKLSPYQRATGQVVLGNLEGVLLVPRQALTWRPLPEEVEAASREAYREYKYQQGPGSPDLVVLFTPVGLRPVKVEVLGASDDRVAVKGPLQEGTSVVVGRAGLE